MDNTRTHLELMECDITTLTDDGGRLDELTRIAKSNSPGRPQPGRHLHRRHP